MITDPLTAIVVIAVSAAACQWLGARLKLPSVLFLLAGGVALSSVLDPDALFGELLFTGVGIGVAILLFEGGTSLNWHNLEAGKVPVLRLVTVGAIVAWVIGSIATALLFDMSAEIAVLIGAILIVSGPTVVMPLLRVVRPREPSGSVLRWEGILIDPVGAALAIVVLDAILEDRSAGRVLLRVVTTFASGLVVGAAVSALMVIALHRRLIADHLQVPMTLAAVIAAYGVANELRPEAGLIAVTLLGVAFANQSRAPAAQIVDFNEHLGASVLGMLFIVLGARVEVDEIIDHAAASALLVAVLVLVARPLTVIASTLGTPLTWRDRGFLMTLAPRGVVAAAVASLFALELEHHDIDPGPLVPVVFSVVVGTVALASLTARFTARRLRVARPDPNGVALIGGGPFAIAMASELGDLGIPVLHVGLDAESAAQASALGQLVYQGRLDSEEFPQTVSSLGIASAVALSGTDHLDGFVTERIGHVVGSSNLYGLPDADAGAEPGTAVTYATQPVLPSDYTAERIARLFDDGVGVRAVRGPRHPRSGWLTICRVDENGKVTFDSDPTAATDSDIQLQLGPGLSPETARR